jgi:hypothetical protein
VPEDIINLFLVSRHSYFLLNNLCSKEILNRVKEHYKSGKNIIKRKNFIFNRENSIK